MKYDGLEKADAEVCRAEENITVYLRGGRSVPAGRSIRRGQAPEPLSRSEWEQERRAGQEPLPPQERLGYSGQSPEALPLWDRERRATQSPEALLPRERERRGTGLRLMPILLTQFAAAALLLVALFALRGTENPAGQKVYGTVMQALQYNMLKDEEEDIGKIKFVGRLRRMKEYEEADARTLSAIAPLEYDSLEAAAGILTFSTSPGRLFTACESGRVEEVGFFGGQKYIELRHNSYTVSRYQGELVSGVKKGDSLKRGEVMGTTDGELLLCVMVDGLPAAALTCEDGALAW